MFVKRQKPVCTGKAGLLKEEWGLSRFNALFGTKEFQRSLGRSNEPGNNLCNHISPGHAGKTTEQQLTHSEKGSPTKASTYPSHKAFMCLYRSDTFSSSQVPNFNL